MRSGYQEDLSVASPILLDRAYKGPKVDKMLAILRDAGALDARRGAVAVDVGCSGGFFTAALKPHFDHVLGVDIDAHALRVAKAADDGVEYLCGDSQRLPLADGSVDLVLCNHVYEHVPDARVLFAEIRRVLRPGGLCYLGAASRLTIIEPHYGLPLLSWLPTPAAHAYMRLAGRGERYYEKLRTHWGIRGLVREFEVIDYTLRVIEDPDRYHARDVLPRGSLAARVPLPVWRALYPLLPTYLLILRKGS